MNKNEGSALMYSDDGAFQVMVLLIQKGNKTEVAKLLKKDKANPWKKSNRGQSLLHFACESGNEEIVNLLIDKYKLEINDIDQLGWTPLHSACNAGQLTTAENLINKGAFVRAMTDQGATPLHFLSQNKDDNPLLVHKVISLLIKKGNSVDIKNRAGETPLHLAAANGRQQYLLYLINSKADLNATTLEGDTPLKSAIKADKIQCVEILMKMGAKIDGIVEYAKGLNASETMISLLTSFTTRSPTPDIRVSPDVRTSHNSDPNLSSSINNTDTENNNPNNNNNDDNSTSKKKKRGNPRELFRLQTLTGNSASFKSHKQFKQEQEKAEPAVVQPVVRKRSNSISHFSPRDGPPDPSLLDNPSQPQSIDPSTLSSLLSDPNPNNNNNDNNNNNENNNNINNDVVETRRRRAETIQERIKKLQQTVNEEKDETEHEVYRASSAESSVFSRIKQFENTPQTSRELTKRIEQFKKGISQDIDSPNPYTYLSPPISKDKKSSRSHSLLPISPNQRKRPSANLHQRMKTKSKDGDGTELPLVDHLPKRLSSSEPFTPSVVSSSQSIPHSRSNEHIVQKKKTTLSILYEQLIEQLNCEKGGEVKCKLANEPTLARCRHRCSTASPLPLIYFCQNPYQYDLLPDDKKDVRSQISSDLCSIDNLQFFIRGLIELPILLPSFTPPSDESTNGEGGNPPIADGDWEVEVEKEKEKINRFIFGVWVKLDCADFFKVMDSWKDNKLLELAGTLNSQLPVYDETLNLPVTFSTRPDGLRPLVTIHQSSTHLLASEQSNGITLIRLASILNQLLNQSG